MTSDTAFLTRSALRDLARRDPELPGLRLAFDAEALAATLANAAPRAELGAVRFGYIRYRPHEYCRVECRLELSGVEVMAEIRACRPEDLAARSTRGAPVNGSGPLGASRIVLQGPSVIVTVFPDDPALPALRHLCEPEGRAQLLSELLPGREEFRGSDVHILRYRAELRYVAEVRGVDGTRVVLKAYTQGHFSRCRHNARVFRSGGPLRLARLLGGSEAHRMLAFEWVTGRALMELCVAAEVDRQALSATGAALAALHAQRPEGLGRWTREAELADLESVSKEVGFICPPLGRRANTVARRIMAKLANMPEVACAVHGDFSPGQVLADSPRVALIDLDWACYGDPADDIGNFLARLERRVLRGEMSSEQYRAACQALLEGYGAEGAERLRERIETYRAVQVFRCTRSPFRAREAGWQERTESLLERAAEIAEGRE